MFLRSQMSYLIKMSPVQLRSNSSALSLPSLFVQIVLVNICCDELCMGSCPKEVVSVVTRAAGVCPPPLMMLTADMDTPPICTTLTVRVRRPGENHQTRCEAKSCFHNY